MLICVSADEFADLVNGHKAVPAIPLDRVLVRCGDRELQCEVLNAGLDRTNRQLLLTLARVGQPGDDHAAEDTPAHAPAPTINAEANGDDPDYDFRQHAAVRQSFHP